MAKQSLEGVKVLDFGVTGVGPLVPMCLAHHGATVIRIESRRRLDISRIMGPFKDNIPGPNRAYSHPRNNQNKLGMTLDLTNPKGKEIARRLVAWADIVSESYAAGVFDRLGLGYDDLRKIKPDIIVYNTSNLGRTGPEAGMIGYGPHLTAYLGLPYLTGWPDRLPSMPYFAYTDYLSPKFGITAVMAALDYRRRTGKGQHIDLSQMECAVHFMAPIIMDYTVNGRVQSRDGNKCPYAVPHSAYPCKGDDRWCAISVATDEEWNALCGVLGNPEWTKQAKFSTILGRKQNEDELNERLSRCTADFVAEELMELLQTANVPAGIVENGEDRQKDPQLAYRGFFRRLSHPEMGEVVCEGDGFILSKTPAEIKTPGPLLGEHTELICREILGMNDDEFIDLYNQGVFE